MRRVSGRENLKRHYYDWRKKAAPPSSKLQAEYDVCHTSSSWRVSVHVLLLRCDDREQPGVCAARGSSHQLSRSQLALARCPDAPPPAYQNLCFSLPLTSWSCRQSRQLWLLALGAAAAAVTAAHHAAFWAPLVLLALAVVAAGSLCGSSSGLSPTQPPAAALQQVIRSRRSVYPKDMTGDNSSITHDKLEAMLEAARWAPTHKLTEPWRFVVLEGSAKAQFEVRAWSGGARQSRWGAFLGGGGGLRSCCWAA